MYILFDIGATKMRVSASADAQTFMEPRIVPTPKHFDDGIQMFLRIAKELVAGTKITGAAGGIVGPFDKAKQQLVNSPHLPGWNKHPFKSTLEKAFGVPVYMENDTDMVGLGEATFGAGKGYDIVMYVTVSTGVGGARIVYQKIDSGSFGTEPGHQIIDPSGELASSGTLEDYVSGTAVERRFGKKPYEIDDKKVWDELAKWLAYGLYNSIVHWSPDVVILGGSMMTKKLSIPLDVTKKHLQQLMKIFPTIPVMKLAQLGDVGGLYGALYYINHFNLNA